MDGGQLGAEVFQPAPQHIRDLLNVLDATKTPAFFMGNLGGRFEREDLGTIG